MKIFLIKELFDGGDNSIVVGVYVNPVKAMAALKERKDEYKVNLAAAAECRIKCRGDFYAHTIQEAEDDAATMRSRCSRADIKIRHVGNCYFPECKNNKKDWYYVDGYRLDAVEAVE